MTLFELKTSRQFRSYRDLLLVWTFRTVRARYQQSALGVLWAIIQPVATVAIFTIIFTRFVPIDTGDIPYAVFSFAALVPWTFFSTSVSDMSEALTTNMNLVAKISFPRDVLVVAALAARLLDFLIMFAVLLILMLILGLPILSTKWLFLPLILAIQVSLSLGLGLFAAAINVFFRDVKHLVVLGLQLWLYATPIIYPVTMVPPELRALYFMNPMAGVIHSFRSVLLYDELLYDAVPGFYLFISSAVAAVVLVGGYIFFKRVEHRFADII